MRNKLKRLLMLLALAGILISAALGQNRQDTGEIETALEKVVEISRKMEVGLSEIVFDTEEAMSVTETVYAEASEAENTETETSETELTEEQAAELSTHYGTYRITELYDTAYNRVKGYEPTDQELDMMLGRVVEIKPERLITYDCERLLGTRDGRYGFSNYDIERYTVDSPKYEYQRISKREIESEDTDGWLVSNVGRDKFDQIDGIITGPQLCEPFGTQFFYTLTDKSKLILGSDLFPSANFLLERCEDAPKEDHAKWGEQEAKELMKDIYGAYQVTEFLPTKFFPLGDKAEMGYDALSEEEASLMTGRIITVSEDFFVTCDNDRHPHQKRQETGYWVADEGIVDPDYRVKTVWADEIYGIRDGMLTGELAKEEYVEIAVYPGFWASDANLPKMYLADEKRIILYAMGQYFLLERTEDEKAAVNEKDLSVWLGTYNYAGNEDETKEYWVEIREKSPGEYEADMGWIYITEKIKSRVAVKASVYGDNEKISFLFKEMASGKTLWNEGDVLLRLRRDIDTGEIYTYWGSFGFSEDVDDWNLDTQDKEAGKKCFVKE